MIIKGLFGRYERWNPVHPTYGAFWGMGIGIGCGVGWGPGFGPEVIGYVGSGCGFGFHVGVTLAGVGIGLPTNCIYTVPYNAIMQARSGGFDLAQSGNCLSTKREEGAHNNIGHLISDLQKEARGRLSSLQQKYSLNKGAREHDEKSLLQNHANSFRDSIGGFVGRVLQPRKGRVCWILYYLEHPLQNEEGWDEYYKSIKRKEEFGRLLYNI